MLEIIGMRERADLEVNFENGKYFQLPEDCVFLAYSGQPLIKMIFSQENVLCEVSIWKREDKLRLTCFDS